MAIAAAHCLYDEEEQMQIMSLLTNENLLVVENDADSDDDAGLEEDFKALWARVAALQDEDDVLPPESWDWAEGVEVVARWAAERMAQEEEAIHRALSSHRLGEEEAALRAEATRGGAARGR
ncbi:unnamed protein product [Miscanthus lutarioriparius]|uniref:Uncharacterized protein n=1 Tax=Miscanthus lutarioriparius TaxID=422564 RepID=A0A811RH43_9POAL|nr:unnamed protein product [Miscanthus lutarioriparius]